MVLHFADLPPECMALVLSGDVFYHHKLYEGTYCLAENVSVNGHEYWYKPKGEMGVWFGQVYKGWIVGTIAFLGQDIGSMHGPFGQETWPTKNSNGYRYYNSSSWVPASSRDLRFYDRK